MSIPNDIIGSANVSYLGDPFEQYCGLNGKPLIGGWIEVYQAGTDTKYITMQNFDGAMNPFKVPLNADGRVVMLADPSLTYDMYVRNSYGDLVCSRLNVECTCPGNISITGLDTWVRNTDGTLDVSLQTSANNRRVFTVNTHSKLLDVTSPLYFVENSETATVIGFSGESNYATKEYVDSAVSSKLDTAIYSAQSGEFLTDKFEYDDNFNVTGYNGSAFASNGQTYSAGTNIDITDNVISVTGLPTSSDVENAISSAVTNVENKFEYNENNYITAYNNSAFAGTNYSAGDYVNIENDTISVTGLQPSGDYATHDDLTAYQPSGDYATKTELESATSGKMDVTGMTAYQPTGDYATHDDLTAYQPVGDYYSASNPSGFITNDAITGLQPSGDYATHDDLTGYATTALVSSVSSELYSAISGISGDYELVAGSGVELVDDPTAKTTTINVTAEGTPVTAIEQMIESATSGLQPSGDYATTSQLADKLDTTAFSTVSGDFLTAHQDISNLMPKSESANFYPMTGNPSGFLTAHQDLSDYQTTADMTAYQPVSSMTAYQEAGDYYSASNPSGFITDIPAGTMNESAFDYNNSNRITGYNGSAFAQGGGADLDFGYDESGAISSINTSALSDSRAGIPLYVESPLFTGQSGDSAYIGWGYDDSLTQLWTGHATPTNTVVLSESITNFRYLFIRGNSGISDRTPWVIKVDTENVRLFSAITTKTTIIAGSLHPTSNGETNYAIITLNQNSATITPGVYTKGGSIASDSNQSLDGISGYSRI